MKRPAQPRLQPLGHLPHLPAVVVQPRHPPVIRPRLCDPCPLDADNDIDTDGVCGDVDNCPDDPNADQADADGDGIGDACDVGDADGDGVPDGADNCPGDSNAGQEDDDGDGAGNVCDACPDDPDDDIDGDGICGDVDVCPDDPDNDIDGDGICGDVDVCPDDPDNDIDGDGSCGDVDNCPDTANPGQEDADGLGSFGPQRLISNAADGAESVFGADLDGDGDIDVLSASLNDDEIAWYENLNGLGTFAAQRLISTEAASAQTVLAADVDGDGDMDVLSASFFDSKVAWYENLDGAGRFRPRTTDSSPTATPIPPSGPSCGRPGWIDGDDDMDFLSASSATTTRSPGTRTSTAGKFRTAKRDHLHLRRQCSWSPSSRRTSTATGTWTSSPHR